jgi:type IV pilus assembly protein PilB
MTVEPRRVPIETATLENSQTAAAQLLTRSYCTQHDVAPLAYENGILTIGVIKAAAEERIREVRAITGKRVRVQAMTHDAIRDALAKIYAAPDRAKATDVEDPPAIRERDEIYANAVLERASDIHIEPTADGGGRVRLRIDGLLHEDRVIPPALFPRVLAVIRMSTGKGIASTLRPIDARMTITVDHRSIDARISSVPLIAGEKIVIRLLTQHLLVPRLSELGMSETSLAIYRRALGAPYGAILFVGPTGCGKTTSLYSSVSEIDRKTRNVCSVEDPVEVRIPDVSQMQINEAQDLTFAEALRVLMRQDPNVLIIGEMRDPETVSAGVSASLTGQLVLTTLHSSDALRAINRLTDLGASRSQIVSAFTLIAAQRLVRRLCECRREVAIPAEIQTKWKRVLDRVERPMFGEPVGCPTCRNKGYKGRLGVYELLPVNDAVSNKILEGVPPAELAVVGSQYGYVPMFEAGMEHVLSGETSYEELVRVVTSDT